MMIRGSREVNADGSTRAGRPASTPAGTLAEKVEWLVSHAHPAERGPYSNAEIVTLIEKNTGQRFSHTTIWKLRNGQAANPQMRLIEALARTFGASVIEQHHAPAPRNLGKRNQAQATDWPAHRRTIPSRLGAGRPRTIWFTSGDSTRCG